MILNLKNYTKKVVPSVPERFYQENGHLFFSFIDKNINKKNEKSITQKSRYEYSRDFWLNDTPKKKLVVQVGDFFENKIENILTN